MWDLVFNAAGAEEEVEDWKAERRRIAILAAAVADPRRLPGCSLCDEGVDVVMVVVVAVVKAVLLITLASGAEAAEQAWTSSSSSSVLLWLNNRTKQQ